MKLIQFVQRYPPALGGSESYAHRLSEHFLHRGDSVDVRTTTALALSELWQPRTDAGPADPPRDRLQIRRYTPLRLPARRYLLKAASFIPIRSWQVLAQPCNPICPGMWRDASRSEVPVDLVHGTAFPYSFPLACGLRLARKAQVPFFLTPFLHLGDPTNPRDRTRRQYTAPHLRYLLRHADRVFVQTPSEFAAVEQLGVPSANIVLQGLGVDPEECTGGVAERFRDEWAIPESHCVIGHLANLSEEKGSVDLLQALRELSDIPLTLVLAGPAMPNFLRAWGSCSEKHRVVRTGPLTAEQKKDFFAGIDLFSLPSRSDSFGLVLLEAWANQKPVIAYRAGGPCDLVRQGADGLLVPCGDVVRLAEQIRTLARDPAMRQQLGQAGEVRCRTHFTWARTFQVWDDVLQDYGLIRTS